MSVKKLNEEILDRVGIVISTKPSNRNKQYYAIYWPDGSIRWIFDVTGTTPGFLAFYPAITVRARLGAATMRLVGVFGLMGFFAERINFLKFEENSLIFKALVKYQCDGWALFAGTPGIDRKIVISISRGNNIIKYIKVPISNESHKLISNEFLKLKQLDNLKLKSVIIPYAAEMNDALVVDNVNTNLVRSSFNLGRAHLNFLNEVFAKTNKKISLKSYIEINNFIEKLDIIKRTTARDKMVDVGKVKNIADATLKRIHSLLVNRAHESIYVCFAHGDFTPWNSFVLKGQLVLIDLELSNDESHLGFDFLHFLIQKELMTSQSLKFEKLLIYAKKRFQGFLLKQKIYLNDRQIETYIFLYFLHQSTNYIQKYLLQSDVHYQAISQIDAWNDILVTDNNWAQL